MSNETLPAWGYDVLPEDPALLAGLQWVCRRWLAAGLTLRPLPDGGLTYYPKRLSPLQRGLVEAMRPYKAHIEALLRAHPAMALFTEVLPAGAVRTVCPVCLRLVTCYAPGQIPVHRDMAQRLCGAPVPDPEAGETVPAAPQGPPTAAPDPAQAVLL